MMLQGLGDALTDALAAAITKVEGYAPPGGCIGTTCYPNGTLAYQNNNPGNISFSTTYNYPGCVQSGRFCKYPDLATGNAALDHQIGVQIASGQNLNQFFNQYAPSNENNTSAYVASVAKQTGIDPSTPLNSIESQYAGPGSVDLTTVASSSTDPTATDSTSIDTSTTDTSLLDSLFTPSTSTSTAPDYTTFTIVAAVAIAAALLFTE